ncbi:MAG: simple sugar transport system substrate-binding protein [Thermoleophilaceae bacterium]|nr:simple sugar transport system substrate-binding protein [Thermoleophilaceae bacterium]
MRRALPIAAAAIALLAVGCGKTVETHEPDLAAQPVQPTTPITPRPRADADAPSPRRRVRIAVVTHGQASDPFWAVVKSGIDRAAHELGVSVSYSAPDTTDLGRMRQLIRQAVAAHPDGLVVSIPDGRALGGAIRAAVRSGIPVVSLNSGTDVSRRLGVLAHVGQPDEQAGFAAGRRMARQGVRQAICVEHEKGNAGLAARCRGFGRALRRAGGRSTVVDINLQNRHGAEQTIADAVIEQHVDGMITLGPGGTLPAIGGLRLDRLLGSVRLATFDLSPEVLAALRKGEIDFAVDQQPFLQGYLPIVFLTQNARYGLLPAKGTLVPTGPSFVTRANANAVSALTKQGIR